MDSRVVLKIVLAGIIGFFLVEKFILWRTCFNKECSRHRNASAPLILIGDAFHNFIDGIVITAAFLTSINFGILATLAVVAHEIPQELADFGILIHNGYSRQKALLYNLLSGSTALIGGILAFFALESAEQFIPYALAISAASFIYIALADLVPQMHNKTGSADSIFQFILIITGTLIIYFIKNII